MRDLYSSLEQGPGDRSRHDSKALLLTAPNKPKLGAASACRIRPTSGAHAILLPRRAIAAEIPAQ